jgi:hypothetical protein
VHDLVEAGGGNVDELDAVAAVSGSFKTLGGAGIGDSSIGDSWVCMAYCLASSGLGRLLNVAMMLAFLAISVRLSELLRDQEFMR